MKSLITFLSSLTVWYIIMSFIMWNFFIPTWPWLARASLITLSLLSCTLNKKT